MADNIRTTPLRLRPSEHRTILFVGDLFTAVISVFAAIETWRRYNLSVEVASLVERGIALARAQQLAEEFFTLRVPFWFYLLPIIWLVLKMAVFMFLFIWLKATLPRLRYDQLMRVGWLYLFEFALLGALVTGAVIAFVL